MTREDPTGAIRPEASPERTVGPYRVLRQLGRGAQGTVYLAEHSGLHRKVALKVLDPGIGTQPTVFDRFRREAEITSRLDHPGICAVYETGEDRGVLWIAMRYVDGQPLSKKISTAKEGLGSGTTTSSPVLLERDPLADPARPEAANGPPSSVLSWDGIARVVALFEEVARALHVAHEAGVIHRDVKPGNVMVGNDGKPVIVDFGLAQETTGDHPTLTMTGDLMGTPAYMSPEQLTANRIRLDRRTDVYSLGVSLFECLTLRRPFEAPTRDGLYQAILTREAPDLRELNPAIPTDLRVVVGTALEKDRDRRYQTALDFAEELRRVRLHEPIVARPVGPLTRLARWTQRNRMVAASVVATFVILVTALFFTIGALESTRDARDAAEEHRKRLDHALSLSEPLADLQEANDLETSAEKLWPGYLRDADGTHAMEAWLSRAEALMTRRPGHEVALAGFESGGGACAPDERRRRVEALRALSSKLSVLPGRIADVRLRLDRARTLRRRTIDDHLASWDQIARDLERDGRFATRIEPQAGLVPIGRNPQGWFEFALADSGVPPRRDPRTGELALDERAALVLVLLPGGTREFSVDSWGGDSRPASDPPTFRVTLDPFFMGKHEVSQAQWIRITGGNPAVGSPGAVDGVDLSLMHPVESVTWDEALGFCARLAVRLPTQDEWEHAARSTAGRYFGDAAESRDVEGRENLADTSLRARGQGELTVADWDDGFPLHAPIDALTANGFGLHHMLGNVSEWCSDVYRQPRAASVPLRVDESGAASRPRDERRVVRGSSFQRGFTQAACGWFGGFPPGTFQPTIGFRVARPVDR